jgi:hypothetical protein
MFRTTLALAAALTFGAAVQSANALPMTSIGLHVEKPQLAQTVQFAGGRGFAGRGFGGGRAFASPGRGFGGGRAFAAPGRGFGGPRAFAGPGRGFGGPRAFAGRGFGPRGGFVRGPGFGRPGWVVRRGPSINGFAAGVTALEALVLLNELARQHQ